MTLDWRGRYSQPAMDRLQHDSAFVVQFRRGPDFETGFVEGRVEHVASGRAMRFESMDELLNLFVRLMKDREPARPGNQEEQ